MIANILLKDEYYIYKILNILNRKDSLNELVKDYNYAKTQTGIEETYSRAKYFDVFTDLVAGNYVNTKGVINEPEIKKLKEFIKFLREKGAETNLSSRIMVNETYKENIE